MDLKDLRCFIAVYELNGFARAARSLDTVQSNVSNRVRRLEQLIGAPLFERRHRGIAATAKGELFYQYARKVLERVGELESAMQVKPAA